MKIAYSGNCVKNRAIFYNFRESMTLRIMNGTFDIFPTIFKQVYSIHILTIVAIRILKIKNQKKTLYIVFINKNIFYADTNFYLCDTQFFLFDIK